MTIPWQVLWICFYIGTRCCRLDTRPEGAVSGTWTRCCYLCSSSSSYRETPGWSRSTGCRVACTGSHEGVGEHCKYVLSCCYTKLLTCCVFQNWMPSSVMFHLAEVFELHMEELRAKQEEIAKKDSDIKVLEAIIRTLSNKDDGGSSEWLPYTGSVRFSIEAFMFKYLCCISHFSCKPFNSQMIVNCFNKIESALRWTFAMVYFLL